MSTEHLPLAVVTGGGGELGQAIASALLAGGYRIGIVDRTTEIARDAAARISDDADRVRGVGANQEKQSEVRVALDELAGWGGAPAVTVANAGYAKFAPMLEMDPRVWDRHIAVNLSGTFYVCQVSAQLMASAGLGGSIIVISSSLARAHSDQVGAYCVSKAALLPMVTSLAAELGVYGIRVNTVLPGVIETAMTEPMLAEGGTRAALLDSTPSGRLGATSDIADAVLFLAGGRSSWITGAHLDVDGGQSIYGQPRWITQHRETPGHPTWGPGLVPTNVHPHGNKENEQ